MDRSFGDIGLMGSRQSFTWRKYKNPHVASVSSSTEVIPNHPLCGPVSFSLFSVGIPQM